MAKQVDIDEVTEMLESFVMYAEEEITQVQCVDCERVMGFEDGTAANELFLVLLAHDCEEMTDFVPTSIEPTKQDVTRTIRGLNTMLKKSAQE